jgi:hypothetical protein
MTAEPGRSRDKHRSISMPQWLITAVAVGAAALFGLAIGLLISSRALGVKVPWFRRETNLTWERQVSLMTKADPKVGATLKLPAIEDLQKQPVQLPLPGVPVLLYVESYEVGESDIKSLEAEMAAYPGVRSCVVFLLSDPKKVYQEAQSRGFRSLFLYDRAGQMRQALNAFGNARLYVFGREGRLLFVQNPLDSDKETIRKARKALETALRGA